MNKYTVSFETEDWTCGDGCCDGSDTRVIVNDIEIGTYADLYMSSFEGINKFIDVLNEDNEELTLQFKIELDEDGDFEDVIYLNTTKITNTMWACGVYPDILNKLKIPHRYAVYNVDWEIWDKVKQLVLTIEEDEIRNH